MENARSANRAAAREALRQGGAFNANAGREELRITEMFSEYLEGAYPPPQSVGAYDRVGTPFFNADDFLDRMLAFKAADLNLKVVELSKVKVSVSKLVAAGLQSQAGKLGKDLLELLAKDSLKEYALATKYRPLVAEYERKVESGHAERALLEQVDSIQLPTYTPYGN